MSDVDQVRDDVSQLKAAIEELTNGKWSWKADGAAAAVALSSLSALLMGALALLMQLGVVGG